LIVTENRNNVDIYSYISDGPYKKYSLTPSHWFFCGLPPMIIEATKALPLCPLVSSFI